MNVVIILTVLNSEITGQVIYNLSGSLKTQTGKTKVTEIKIPCFI